MNTAGPLAGLRVVDCTSVVMGPYATSLLADLGAEVTKVEPLGGDVGRRVGARGNEGLSALSMRLLRGKRSLAVDLADPKDRARVESLIAEADALVTNILPSARQRFGLDYETLSGINPSIVLCTGQAYSSTSPQRDVPGYDDTIQALSGMADIYRLRDGEPAFSPSVTVDKTCGLLMALATVSALLARERGATGQWVDVPMVDSMVAFNLVEHLAGQTFMPAAGDVGWARSIAPNRRPHRASDGWVCVMPYTDANWRAFVKLADQPELADDPRYRDVTSRSVRSDEVQQIIADFVAPRAVADVVAECESASIACAPVRSIEELLDDDYLHERGVVRRAEHPRAGAYWDVGLPMDFSRTPLQQAAPAPDVDVCGP